MSGWLTPDGRQVSSLAHPQLAQALGHYEPPAVFHLRQALEALEKEKCGLPPFSVRRAACITELEQLRQMIRARA